MKMGITMETRQHRFGRSTLQAMAALALALLVLGTMLHGAAAKPYNAGQLSKGSFTAACDSVGGKTSTKGNVVRCNYPNGTYETCKFTKGKPTTCNYIPIQTTTSGAQGQFTTTTASGTTTSAEIGPLESIFAVADESR